MEPDSEVRDGAWVAELDGDVLKDWPTGMRLIVRKERPHPGAQLRSPTPTACGSPASPPTPRTPRSRLWSCGTANAPTPRTVSAPLATPVCDAAYADFAERLETCTHVSSHIRPACCTAASPADVCGVSGRQAPARVLGPPVRAMCRPSGRTCTDVALSPSG